MKGIRKCKVCGREYPYCMSLRKGVFRWQDVACCPKHGEIYLARIAESRSKNNEVKTEPEEDDNKVSEIKPEAAVIEESPAVNEPSEPIDKPYNADEYGFYYNDEDNDEDDDEEWDNDWDGDDENEDEDEDEFI